MRADLRRRLVAEGIGTAFLVAIVVGSGIMAAKLAAGNTAVALLANAIATGAGLVVLITILGPLSGAHFNPAVSLSLALRGQFRPSDVMAYCLVQVAGGCAGTVIAHTMFDLPLLQVSTTSRAGMGQWIAEFIAAFGLLGTIIGGVRFAPTSVPNLVGLYITAAYWFTASTSFANPAVTIARSLSDTFAGIAPLHVPGFIIAQIAGATAGAVFWHWLIEDR